MAVSEQISELITSFYTAFESVGDFTFEFFNANSRTILDRLHIGFNGAFDVLFYITIALTLFYLGLAVASFFVKKQKETLAEDKDLPLITVQIPTFNELAALNCARRCLAFDYPQDKVQIIIGDDSNKKEISARIDEFAAQYKNVDVTRRGKNIGFKPGNLNHMLKYTKGEFIIIFDSDFLPEPDFARRIISPMVFDKDIHAVQSRWKMANFGQNFHSIIGSIIPMYSHKLGLPNLRAMGSNGFIAGSGEAVRKSTLLEQGSWTSGAFTEDIEYSLRLTKAGKRIMYLDQLECDCEAPFTLPDLCKQQMRWGYGVIVGLKMHIWDIIKSTNIKWQWKVNPLILLLGYVLTFNFFLLFVLGILSILTHEPGPVMWNVFFRETGVNLLLTMGTLLTSAIIINREQKHWLYPSMIAASFTVGLAVIYTASVGVIKALFNRPMFWFMLTKKGNENA